MPVFSKKSDGSPGARELVASGGLSHIAFIMDGNGRWAKRRGMPRSFGHESGARAFRKIVRYCFSIGIRYVTVYAFSTENWNRPAAEVGAIMKLLREYLADGEKTAFEDKVCIRFIGDLSVFDEEFRERAARLAEASSVFPSVLSVAVNYGGRGEIAAAATKLAAGGKTLITPDDLSSELYTAGTPDPDLIVRTGGEMRISNFLIWQAAYAELYFTDVLWPDMTEGDVDAAVRDFFGRQRRFGGLGSDKGTDGKA